jgi:hypothetical protein
LHLNINQRDELLVFLDGFLIERHIYRRFVAGARGRSKVVDKEPRLKLDGAGLLSMNITLFVDINTRD